MEMSETKTFPTYPTDDMWEAFFLHHHANDSVSEIRFWEGDFGNFAASYAAMRSVAPAPSEEGELAKLKAFARWTLSGYAGGPLGDIDGGALQDKAEALGLLVGTEVTESCGEGCVCVEYDAFPLTCYRQAEWLKEQSGNE